MGGSISCAACNESNDVNAKFCRKCGQEIAEQGAGVADNRFDIWWMLGGVAIMFGTNFAAGLLIGLTGAGVGRGALALIALGAFALGGFIVGRFSKGKTILEPAVSAAIAIGLTLLLSGQFSVLGLVIGGLFPFLAGLLGGWLGEKAQGTI